MAPFGRPTEETAAALEQRFEAGDLIVDGGNSNQKDAVGHATGLGERGVHLDADKVSS